MVALQRRATYSDRLMGDDVFSFRFSSCRYSELKIWTVTLPKKKQRRKQHAQKGERFSTNSPMETLCQGGFALSCKGIGMPGTLDCR